MFFCRPGGNHKLAHLLTSSHVSEALTEIRMTCSTPRQAEATLSSPCLSFALVYISVLAASHLLHSRLFLASLALDFSCLVLHGLLSPSGILTPWELLSVSLPAPLSHLSHCPGTFYLFMMSLSTCLPPGVSPWVSPSCCPGSPIFQLANDLSL